MVLQQRHRLGQSAQSDAERALDDPRLSHNAVLDGERRGLAANEDSSPLRSEFATEPSCLGHLTPAPTLQQSPAKSARIRASDDRSGFDDLAIGIRAPIAEQRPGAAHFLDSGRVEVGNQNFLVVAGLG